jgi:exosortase D (VPLPA-CTERM-specific)
VVQATGNLFFGSLRQRAAAALLAMLLLVAFFPTLLEMGREWFKHPEYGHGVLMPPVALWMVWERRRRLAALRRTGRGSPWVEIVAAMALVPLGLALLLGEMRLSWFLKPFAFVAAIAACIAILYSWQGLKALAAPLFVLCLMCPIPWRVLVWITLPLKRHATVLATGLADLSGLQASLDGNLIHVPGIASLQVVDQCSGVRSLLSLVSIALLGCLFWRRHALLKAVLVLSCAPIAVAVNALRIWLTAFLAVHVSPEAAQGFFHFFEGFVLFGVAALALLGWASLLGRLSPARPPAAAAPRPAAGFRDRPLLRGAAVALAVATLVPTAYAARSVRARLADAGADAAAVERMQGAFAGLPLEIGGYRGERRPWDESTVRAAGADAYGSVRYTDARGRRYDVFLGGALRNDDNFHSPNVCMPSAGWETLSARSEPLRAFGTEPAPIMQRLLLQRGDERMLVCYWFQAGARLAGDEWTVRFYRLLDLLSGRALSPTLIVSVYVPVEEDVPAAEAATQRFLAAVAPSLRAATTSGGIHE